jgi:hypothetical protein
MAGQQRGGQTIREDEMDAKGTEDSTFLGPDEARDLLSSLEAEDRRMLGASGATREADIAEEEGSFIAPDELASFCEASPQVKPKSDASAELEHGEYSEIPKSRAEGLQSNLLTRIAGELRAIKTELGALKGNYDEMLSRDFAPIGEPDSVPSPDETENSAEDGHFVPIETYEEIRKLLGYLDRLLESLPEEKIDEFAASEYFELYRKVFEFFDLA